MQREIHGASDRFARFGEYRFIHHEREPFRFRRPCAGKASPGAPFESGTFYGIIRATDSETSQGITNKVVVFQTNVPKRDPKDWLEEAYRFRP